MPFILRAVVLGAFAAAAAAADDAELLALRGVEPFYGIAAEGVTLPPSADELAALPPAERARQQAAVKRVLLLRTAHANEDDDRVTADNESDSAGRAREWECPPVLADIFQELAEGEPTARRRYALNSALNAVTEVYGIDALLIRHMVETANLNRKTAAALADMLPLACVFNEASATPPTPDTMADDAALLAEVYEELTACYADIKDEASAAAALPKLMPLLQCADTATDTRLMIARCMVPETPRTIPAMERYMAARAALTAERRRLAEQEWFAHPLLPAVDYLFD